MLVTPSTAETARALLLQCLQEGATHLSWFKPLAAWRLITLIVSCSRDLNIDISSARRLIEAGDALRFQDDIRRTKEAWNKRLATLPADAVGRPRLVILLPDGQCVRSFLLTDVCSKVSNWAELFILSPLDIEKDVAALGPNAHFLPVPVVERNSFDTLVGYLGFRQTGSSTNMRFVERLDENLEQALRNNKPIVGRLRAWQMAKNYLSDADYLRLYGWTLKVFAKSYCLNEFVDLLRRLRPDLVVNASFVPWSARLWTRAAALSNIPVITNVISWDNMSTKTLLDEFSDAYLIWSEEMDEDFATTVPFLRNTPRAIVGSPQFEPIVQRRGLVPREEFLARYGLDPGKKLILYTTGSKTLFPREHECLDTVLDHWRHHLREKANIMIRMHPKDRQGRYNPVRKKFPEVPFTLAGQNLAADEDWVPTQDDIALLVNQLHHCDVIVNVASTMTLEGFSIDKPAINIGFTLGLSVSQRYPMEDYYKSRHYRDIVDTGAARWVGDYEELFAAIDDVLQRSAYDLETQRRVLRMKCKHTDDSSNRINEFLARYVAR